MIIPPERLTEQVLRGIVEAYILRDGTDYGDVELALEIKVEQLLPLVIKGEVLIVYDEKLESVSLITRHAHEKQQVVNT